jgi:hypothetical protein
MEHNEMGTLELQGSSVSEAASDLKSATTSQPEATQHFLSLLATLAEFMKAGVTHPSTVVGNKDVEEVEQAGKQVGCTV